MNEWRNISFEQATLDFLLNLLQRFYVSTGTGGQDGDVRNSFLYSLTPFPGPPSCLDHPARTPWISHDTQSFQHHLDRSEAKPRKSLELLKHVTFPTW